MITSPSEMAMNAPWPNSPARSSLGRGSNAEARSQGAGTKISLDLQRLLNGVGTTLARRGETLAVAETAAGGALAMLIHANPAHEEWFRGGIIVYAGSRTPLVQSIQDVASEHGVVSEEYAAAMAQLARRTFACDWALAESGIAGPQTGRRSAKPVGMACLAVAGPGEEGGDAPGQEVSLRATGACDDEGGAARGREVSRPAIAVSRGGEGRVWTTTRLLADAGRKQNQQRIAVEALRLLRFVHQEHGRGK